MEELPWKTILRERMEDAPDRGVRVKVLKRRCLVRCRRNLQAARHFCIKRWHGARGYREVGLLPVSRCSSQTNAAQEAAEQRLVADGVTDIDTCVVRSPCTVLPSIGRKLHCKNPLSLSSTAGRSCSGSQQT